MHLPQSAAHRISELNLFLYLRISGVSLGGRVLTGLTLTTEPLRDGSDLRGSASRPSWPNAAGIFREVVQVRLDTTMSLNYLQPFIKGPIWCSFSVSNFILGILSKLFTCFNVQKTNSFSWPPCFCISSASVFCNHSCCCGYCPRRWLKSCGHSVLSVFILYWSCVLIT